MEAAVCREEEVGAGRQATHCEEEERRVRVIGGPNGKGQGATGYERWSLSGPDWKIPYGGSRVHSL
jgi:hypothetical protein